MAGVRCTPSGSISRIDVPVRIGPQIGLDFQLVFSVFINIVAFDAQKNVS